MIALTAGPAASTSREDEEIQSYVGKTPVARSCDISPLDLCGCAMTVMDIRQRTSIDRFSRHVRGADFRLIFLHFSTTSSVKPAP